MIKPGDLVALVSPSGPVPEDRVRKAEQVLQGWGLRTWLGVHALRQHTYLAGDDEQRLEDLNRAFRDPEVRAVLALRGGYGMQRIVDRVDFDAVRSDPKLVMGFSDITALHLALWAETGLVTLHGPVAAQFDKGPDSRTAEAARRALMTDDPITVAAEPDEDTYPIRTGGKASGILLGGNLSLLASTVGTRHAPDLRGKILLIEDVDEEPYRIDRMLTHLTRAGWFDGLAGIALGQFTNCGDPLNILKDRCKTGTVLGGLPIGHGDQQLTVPLGAMAELDADRGTLTVQSA
jgi:muramoyltetrapeptide carboxypeptidase